MKNYEKYAAGKEKVAELIRWFTDNDPDILIRQVCDGTCRKNQKEDANCIDENLKACILAWLDKEVAE